MKDIKVNMYYVYIYLDTRKKAHILYGEFHFDYEPFYVGKETKERLGCRKYGL